MNFFFAQLPSKEHNKKNNNRKIKRGPQLGIDQGLVSNQNVIEEIEMYSEIGK